jgi:hypothetical protein
MFNIDDSNVTPHLLNAADNKVVIHFEKLEVHYQSEMCRYLGIFTLWYIYQFETQNVRDSVTKLTFVMSA